MCNVIKIQFFYAFYILAVVQALKLKELIVPRHANLGSSAVLDCKFDLGDASLYSVKWYKDEFEFFRFMPDNKPETQVFPVNGISLDVRLNCFSRKYYY